ncbi:biopolymer transporter ExbD [Sesbania bispinosa]|nr:biopolymer transporter ExbD [Sesbania bispinosa]
MGYSQISTSSGPIHRHTHRTTFGIWRTRMTTSKRNTFAQDHRFLVLWLNERNRSLLELRKLGHLGILGKKNP